MDPVVRVTLLTLLTGQTIGRRVISHLTAKIGWQGMILTAHTHTHHVPNISSQVAFVLDNKHTFQTPKWYHPGTPNPSSKIPIGRASAECEVKTSSSSLRDA